MTIFVRVETRTNAHFLVMNPAVYAIHLLNCSVTLMTYF